jgi:hypothetical protein
VAKRTCSIDGCDNKTLARGWCSTHYSRWRLHDDPLHVHVRVPAGPLTYIERTDRLLALDRVA